MNSLILFCILGMVTMALAGTSLYPRGCIWIEGRCGESCPEGTQGYSTGCGKKMPEATCDEPNPVLEEGIICDYSACYCDPPNVRDKVNDKCVPLDQCPKKEEEKEGEKEEGKGGEKEEEKGGEIEEGKEGGKKGSYF